MLNPKLKLEPAQFGKVYINIEQTLEIQDICSFTSTVKSKLFLMLFPHLFLSVTHTHTHHILLSDYTNVINSDLP